MPNLLITGICGFVGSTLARCWREQRPDLEIIGIDNLMRPGSERNRAALTRLGITIRHGDIRVAADFEGLPAVDWVLDAAANPSVLAGIDGASSSRQLMQHNLLGTLNLLEYCKAARAGFILLSTSRVYSIAPLAGLPVRAVASAFVPDFAAIDLPGFGEHGIAEAFSTRPPVSLYGASKVASEALAVEYGLTYDFPVWINRCGVLAGAGQFGHAQQGIFSFWLHAWAQQRPLRYIGFGGGGQQVRDCLHPRDLVPVLDRQMQATKADADCVCNCGGGRANALSLAQLSAWCADRWGQREVAGEPETRPFDIPWVVLDSSRAEQRWNFRVQTPIAAVLEEIATFAEAEPHWLEISRGEA
jgi:CDP-paratose 2-epimerase